MKKLICIVLLLSGCASTGYHRAKIQIAQSQQETVQIARSFDVARAQNREIAAGLKKTAQYNEQSGTAFRRIDDKAVVLLQSLP